jgi:hypothetical protein
VSLILDGSNGLSDVDGTAATPAIRGTDTNTGIFFPAADTIAFSEGGTEAMRIDGSGNVGIGTTTPNQKVQIFTTNGTGGQIQIGNSATGSASTDGMLLGFDASNDVILTNQEATAIKIFNNTAREVTIGTNATERMRIDSGGDVYITNGSFVSPPTSGNDVWAGGLVVNPTRRTTGNSGNTYWDPSTGAYFRSTSSLRYKKEVQNATHGIAEVLQLRPVTYKGKAESDGDKVFGGFIAEEIDALGLTEFVQYDTEGRPDSLAYSNMVSLLAKAIQEQQVMITELKATVDAQAARIAALESAGA